MSEKDYGMEEIIQFIPLENYIILFFLGKVAQAKRR